MSTDINPNPKPGPTPAPALDTARVKQIIDTVSNLATTVSSLTPWPQDDLVVQSLKMVLDQDWFAQLIVKMVNTPHQQRVAMAADPNLLVNDVA